MTKHQLELKKRELAAIEAKAKAIAAEVEAGEAQHADPMQSMAAEIEALREELERVRKAVDAKTSQPIIIQHTPYIYPQPIPVRPLQPYDWPYGRRNILWGGGIGGAIENDKARFRLTQTSTTTGGAFGANTLALIEQGAKDIADGKGVSRSFTTTG